jgi:hypothetical protein
MAIAIGVWLAVKHKELPAGLFFALAVLVRPPVVILGTGFALVKAIWDRSLRPLITIGFPSVLAAVAYLIYGRVIFGSWSPSAAYEAVGGFWGVDSWLGNTLTALISPQYGVLVWSAWLAVGIVLVLPFGGRRTRPDWMVPLVAGVYVVVHSALEGASGGMPYNYRYPLEAVTLTAPFLIAALLEGMSYRIGRIVLVVAGTTAVMLQGMWSLTSRCGIYPENPGETVCLLLGWSR